MGLRRGWAALSAVAFVVWCFDTLAQRPHAIIHECTEDFNTRYLELIFGAFYIISSFVFSPKDLGYPANRNRRYTIMLLRTCCAPTVSYDISGFAELFFHRCICSGHIFWQAPVEMVQASIDRMAARLMLAPMNDDGNHWTCREVMAVALQGRLEAYERLCRKTFRRPVFIVNLSQTPTWSNTLSELAPALLTKTSTLWSMTASRLLLPCEHLLVQGVPLLQEGRAWQNRFAVEKLCMNGKLTGQDLTLLAGNGMNLSAIGSVILFVLATVDVPNVRNAAQERVLTIQAAGTDDDDDSDPEL